jgi:type II and III secretion system protein
VNIQVRVVEVSRSLTHSLGFNWGAVLNTGRGPLFLGNGTSQGLFSSHASNNSHFNPDGSFEDGNANIPGLMPDSNTAGAALGGIFNMGRMSLGVLINAMSESGFASLLAEPNLTAMSGQPAAFASGGEVPIVIITGNSITIDYKSWGVILRMTPTVLSPNRIAIHVAPEVSELTSEGQVILSEGSVIPAVRVRRAETTVELASGQSFALAGMLRSESSQTVNGVPGLRNLPFVGRLFEYEQTQVEDSELVILLTANIVDPVSSGDLRVPGRGINAVDAYAPRQASIGYLF